MNAFGERITSIKGNINGVRWRIRGNPSHKWIRRYEFLILHSDRRAAKRNSFLVVARVVKGNKFCGVAPSFRLTLIFYESTMYASYVARLI